jgi:hypothetical protein
MRFKIGKPPEMDCVIENANQLVIDYKKIPVIGFFVGLVTAVFAYLIWRIFLGNAVIFKIFDAEPLIFLGSLAAIVISHEICHLLTHPKFGLSNNSCVGIYPEIWLPYAAYSGVMTRRRLLIILLAPLFALTFVPFVLVVCNVFSSWSYVLAWCSVLNMLLSGGDIYMSMLVLKIIPPLNFVHGHFYGATKKTSSCLHSAD